MDTITGYIGDSSSWAIALTHPVTGAAFEPGGSYGLVATFKNRENDSDANAVIQKATGAGITVSGSTATVTLVRADTADFCECNLHFGIRATNASTGASFTVAERRVKFEKPTTIETTTSVDVVTTETPLPFGGITSYVDEIETLPDYPASFPPASHTHVSADITDASEGGNGAADAGKLVKFTEDGSLIAATIYLQSDDLTAAYAVSNTSTGLYGQSNSGAGVAGISTTLTGVAAVSDSGTGITAQSTTGTYHARFGEGGNDKSAIERVRGWFVWFYSTFVGRLKTADITSNRDWTLPDASGTIALTSDLDNRQKFENWVFEGDSWTAGTAQGNSLETYPYYLARLAPQYGVNFYNVATVGQTAQTMVSTFAAQVEPYLTATTGLPSTAFIFAGINDAATRTTTQLRDDLRSLWTSARNAGARVVAFTLPHRTAAGGWSDANWKIINDQIVADSSYYDFLVRTDIVFNNALSSEFSDNLHVTTAAHKKFAGQILRVMNGGDVYPSLPSDITCNVISTSALAASTYRNLPFTEVYDANNDASTATVGSDSNVRVFTCPTDGTYEVSGSFLLGSLTSGDLGFLSAWVTPIATGTAVEHRVHLDQAGGANMGLMGVKRFRLLRGDKIHLSAHTSRANATILANSNFSTFQVRLVSIP